MLCNISENKTEVIKRDEGTRDEGQGTRKMRSLRRGWRDTRPQSIKKGKQPFKTVCLYMLDKLP